MFRNNRNFLLQFSNKFAVSIILFLGVPMAASAQTVTYPVPIQIGLLPMFVVTTGTRVTTVTGCPISGENGVFTEADGPTEVVLMPFMVQGGIPGFFGINVSVPWQPFVLPSALQPANVVVVVNGVSQASGMSFSPAPITKSEQVSGFGTVTYTETYTASVSGVTFNERWTGSYTATSALPNNYTFTSSYDIPLGKQVFSYNRTSSGTVANVPSPGCTSSVNDNETGTNTLFWSLANAIVVASALPSGTSGVPYPPKGQTAQLISGGIAPYVVSATGLPPGLTINSDGTVTGTPESATTRSFEIMISSVTDAEGLLQGPADVPITIRAATPDCRVPPVSPPLAGSAWYQLDANWRHDPYNSVRGPRDTIGDRGDLLTALNYVLNAAGQKFNPASLNSDIDKFSLDYSIPLAHSVGGGAIILGSTVEDVSGARLVFSRAKSGSISPSDLDAYICDSSMPVIIEVSDPATGYQHYVVATGKTADGYSIVDPGYSSGGNEPRTTLAAYGNKFKIVGVVSPSTGSDSSELDLSIVDNATLLVSAPDQSKTGVQQGTESILKGSPQSAYLVIDNAIDTDMATVAPTSTTYSVQEHAPGDGRYSVRVKGLQLGPYHLFVKVLDARGKPQTFLSLPGIASAGSTSTFEIHFTSKPNSRSRASVVASFESTLADLANAERSDMIRGRKLGSILSDLIKIAERASYRRDPIGEEEELLALNVFRQVVVVESRRQIKGVAPEVLLNDAESLISQIDERK